MRLDGINEVSGMWFSHTSSLKKIGISKHVYYSVDLFTIYLVIYEDHSSFFLNLQSLEIFLLAILIKVLKRREECDTYLTHVCRHRWRRESPARRRNITSFESTLWLLSAVDVAVYIYR